MDEEAHEEYDNAP
jgi:hypothetical protein